MPQLKLQWPSLRRSLATRFLVYATAILVSATLVFGAVVLFFDYERELADLAREATVRADFLGSISPESVLLNDFLPLETLMRQTSTEEDVVYSIIVANDGRPLTRFLNRDDPLINAALAESGATDVLQVIEAVRTSRGVIEIRRPIVSEGLVLGEIWLAYSTGRAQQRLASATLTVLSAVVLISLLLATLTFLLFNWQIQSRLLSVTSLAQTLAAGDLSQRAEVIREDEISELKGAFNTMAAQLQATLAGLREANAAAEAANTALRVSEAEARKLSEVASRTANMVIITDAKGRVEWVNDAFERVTGYSLVEMVGKVPGHILQGPDTDQETVAFIRAKLAAGEGFAREILNYNRKGESYWVLVEVKPVRNAANEIVNFIAVETDITEQRTTEQNLRRAKESAEAADRAKSEFLANMSHEIRTPMNAVIGLAGILLDTPLDVEQRGFVKTIRQSGNELLTIINEILDFSKIESGQLILDPHPFDLRRTVEDTLDIVVPARAAKQLDLAYFIERDIPVRLWGDSTRLRQILLNLLSNAVKFTTSGEVFVHFQGEKLPDRSYRLTVKVRDTGIGISAAGSQQLFKPFSQVDASTTRRYGGTGLGLVICRRLCRMMGGDIRIESEPGVGSTFIFDVVVTVPEDQPSAEVAPPDLKNRRILVVDDNETNLNIVSHHLQAWGMIFETETDPLSALRRLQQGATFDAAILDIFMPDMDGIMLAKAIQEHAPDLPLIFLSSSGRSELPPLPITAAAFLTKPLKPSLLLEAFTGLFSDQAVRVSPQATTGLISDRGFAARHPLRILVADDIEVNQRVALLMLDRLGYRADTVGNGIEVLTALSRLTYDVILMDIQMPEMDGLEATRIIRSGQSGATGPCIVAMTANAMARDRDVCLAAGMNDYLSKPLQPEVLMTALARCARERATTGSSPAGSAIDLSDLHTRHGADALAMVTFLWPTFLEEIPSVLSEMESGLREADPERVRRAAHSIKGSAGAVGAVELARQADQIEKLGRIKDLNSINESLPKLREAWDQVAAFTLPEIRETDNPD